MTSRVDDQNGENIEIKPILCCREMVESRGNAWDRVTRRVVPALFLFQVSRKCVFWLFHLEEILHFSQTEMGCVDYNIQFVLPSRILLSLTHQTYLQHVRVIESE